MNEDWDYKMNQEKKRFGLCECGFIYEHKRGSPLCRFQYQVFCRVKQYLTRKEVEIRLGKSLIGFKSDVDKGGF